jgi:hypothetical protein
MRILSEIKRLREEQPKKQCYGSPRLGKELGVNKDRVARIMKASGRVGILAALQNQG